MSLANELCRMEKQSEVLIIGGGLSGLYLAYLLQKQGYQPLVLEASDRLGGRIQTAKGALDTPLELGATWFSAQHPCLLALLAELGLHWYPQYATGITLFQTKSFEPTQQFIVPESDVPSFRLAGGTQQLIEALAAQLPAQRLLRQKRVVQVQELGQQVEAVTADGSRYRGAIVIVCTPPQLAASILHFAPALAPEIAQVLPLVHTWMAGSIKFVVEYATAFWRAQGYSGMLYSHAGIITEMYDHTNYETNRFGLTGFLSGGAAAFEPAVRKELVLKQLVNLLGVEASSPTMYLDKVWNEDYLVTGSPLIRYPHQFNGDPLLQQAYLNGKLFFCGTETATVHGGYMEGAVTAAQRVAAALSQL